MGRTRGSITIQDVALAAGVSVSTVSRVLNNKDDVALETYERVRSVIDQLGYASSLAARGMRSRRTNVIGLIMPDVASPYAAEMMRGVNGAIAKIDYDLLIYTNGNVRKSAFAERDRRFVMLLNGGITDGVIVVTPAATHFPSRAPVVVIDPNNETPEYPAIIATNREGALEVMRYLIRLGHRRIGYITGRLDLISAIHRLQGYKEGLTEAGIPVEEALIQVGDYTTEAAVECARALLSLKEPPTAIFAANDMSAMGVYRAACEAGVSIPRDLSVVGFDNLYEAALMTPPLTTIDQSISEMGALAVDMLVRLVRGENLENHQRVIPTRLILRQSCVPVQQSKTHARNTPIESK